MAELLIPASSCISNGTSICNGTRSKAIQHTIGLAIFLQAQEGRLSEYEVATIMKCVLEFLVDCHQRHICYGDIKPNNFVLRSLYPSIRHLLDPSKPKGGQQQRQGLQSGQPQPRAASARRVAEHQQCCQLR